MQAHPATLTLGQFLIARATANRRRFAGIDEPATPAIAEIVADRSPAERMAEHMREIKAARGFVTQDDLDLKGWTASEILELGGEAARIASRSSVRRA